MIVRLTSNPGEKKKPLSQAQINFWDWSCCIKNSKASLGKLTLTVVEGQQLPDVQKIDSEVELFA